MNDVIPDFMEGVLRPWRSSVANAACKKSLLAGFVMGLLAPAALAQDTPVRPRITARIDDSNLTVRQGNTHPLARPESDQGAVPDSIPMDRMLLLLHRAPEQEKALTQLLDDQQDPSSPRYRQWLTPQQFGQQFGPADADIQTVSSWLQQQGFQVNRVAAGKTVIEFSGNAGQVRKAFHTEIHKYMVNGEQRSANAADPQIPTALAGVVEGPVTLQNFPRKPQARSAGIFRKIKAANSLTPLFTSGSCGSGRCNALGPGDFATIYNIQKLWVPSSGTPIDGTGQSIAIVGDSEICTANSPIFATSCNGVDDVAGFRSLFGLPAKSPNVIVDGADPGLNGDEIEGDLDVQWSGAVAKNATIDYVIAKDTSSAFGVDLAAEYIVNNNLASILSESFAGCEEALGNNGNMFFSNLWQQAAAQGITVVVATGDNGSAGCDDSNPSPPNPATGGANVNGIASTPFNVAAGGTEFDATITNYQATYWGSNTTVDGIADVSAKSYIPEITWNESCAQSFTGALSGCDSPPRSSVNIVAASGGQSDCAVQNDTGTRCLSGYAKPSWQTIATGSGLTAGNDLTRTIPDISLFSGDGAVSGSFYVICQADKNPGNAPCSLSAPFSDLVGVGGVSAAAPTFAGMMALVNQNMALNHPSLPDRQGNANYVLYQLASSQGGLNCDPSAAGGPDAGCTFNDVRKGNISVACQGKSFGCSNTTNAATYGVLETANSVGVPSGLLAFSAGTGFDLATGLGSVNALNLVKNWNSSVITFTLSPTPNTATINIVAGQSGAQTITANGSGGFTGTVTLNCGVTPASVSFPPTCSFDTNAVVLSGTATNAQAKLTVSTTAASALLGPTGNFYRKGNDPYWLTAAGMLIAMWCFLPLGIPRSKRHRLAFLSILPVLLVLAAVGCGGGGRNGSGGSPGTGPGTYTVTVTATPTDGAPKQTSIIVNVQ